MSDFDQLPKAYDASSVEDGIYTLWEQSGVFNPDTLPGDRQDPYCIMMPPPNRTGTLHVGHATMLAIEDVLIRFQRMQGKKALWIPGTDHAAIATQSKVESLLIKQGMQNPRQDLGREVLLEKIREFAETSKNTINSQVRKMGSSCDWSRETYTFDEPRNRAVNEMFRRMVEDGVLERGERIVNWDPSMQSNVSDDEMEWVEERTPFYIFQYGPFQIGTARPETKFGDKYVVMHPDDERYAQYAHGEVFECEWINGPIKATVIKDAAIDPNFGTGVMTITPWHDATDFEIAERHGLDKQQIIDLNGKLLDVAGEFAGMGIDEARPKIVEKLKAKGLLIQVDEAYVHNTAVNYRGGGKIEPQIRRQWFVRVNKKFKLRQDTLGAWKKDEEVTLKDLTRYAVESKQIRIIPERFEKTYFHWIDHLRDWCVSRQIWFGHRIPVWYRSETSGAGVGADLSVRPDRSAGGQAHGSAPLDQEMVVSAISPGSEWEQDPDTLDTWFSSGMWTFSTLGWPRTRVIFVRHGQAMGNLRGFMDDGVSAENVLTDMGKEQVQELAEHLKAEHAVAIIASPIVRAKQTAEILSEQLGLRVVFDDRLREVGVGQLNGRSIEEFEQVRRALQNWYTTAPKGMESFTHLRDRIQAFMSDLLRDYAGRTVIVVSHGDPIRAMTVYGTDEEWSKTYPETGGYMIREFANDGRQTNELDFYHPTAVLETGYDILFFWVARMILMSTYALGEVPFKDVYLHGLVRDEQGRKMSKSLGNVIDPLDVIPKYGTDAVRLSLLLGTGPGNDSRLSEEKIAGFRNFTNKLWNISRFILMQIGGDGSGYSAALAPRTLADEWIVSRLDEVAASVTQKIERYELSSAGEELRDFTWGDLADWYLEIVKIEKNDKRNLLIDVLKTILKLWHPFMPFVTEHIWKTAGFEGQLIIAEWPLSLDEKPLVNPQAADEYISFYNKKLKEESLASGIKEIYEKRYEQWIFAKIRSLIIDIRRLRSEQGIEPAKFIDAVVVGAHGDIFGELGRVAPIQENLHIIKHLARLSSCEIAETIPAGWVTTTSGAMQIGLNIAGTVDVAKEREKIQKEIALTQGYLSSTQTKLGNHEFISKAPAQVVEQMQAKYTEAEKKLQALHERLKQLS